MEKVPLKMQKEECRTGRAGHYALCRELIFWGFCTKSFLMVREMQIQVIFWVNIWKLTFFFHNLCCGKPTRLDIESKLPLKNHELMHSSVALDVARCL